MLFKRAILRRFVRPAVNLVVASAIVLVTVVGSSALLLGPKSVAAQDVTVVVEGPLQSINNNLWVVNGQTIEINATTSVTGTPAIGNVVRVVAKQRADGKVIAVTITIMFVTATPTGTPPSPTPTGTQATPTNTLPAPTGTGSATGTPVPFVKIIIEGPVGQVDLTVNVIVVYKQRIRLRANDPIRAKIKKGDWVRCEGNLEREADNRIIIVVINIIIINPPPVIVIVQPGNSNPASGGGGRRGDDDDDDD
jgi:hypothetical protein